MEPTLAAVLAKAQALVTGLSRLPRRARTAVPHGHFARDYNTLRKLALGVALGLDDLHADAKGATGRRSHVWPDDVTGPGKELPSQDEVWYRGGGIVILFHGTTL